MGVVWGEGNGGADQCGPAIGGGISDWIGRLIRTAWRRLFMGGGDALARYAGLPAAALT